MNEKGTRRPGQRQALDGFFSAPVNTNFQARNGNRRQAMPVGSPRLDNFRRPEGFQSQPRRTMGVTPNTPNGVPRQVMPHINMDLPAGGEHLKLKKVKKPQSKFRKTVKWTMRSVGVLALIAIGIGGFLFAKGYIKLHKVFQGTRSAAALTAQVDPSLLKGEGDGRVNVLLLGNGGANHDGGDLTDTMMLASIDPVNKKAALLSIPRDMWVNVPKYGAMKINASYETGKYKYLGKETLSNSNHKATQAGFSEVDQVVEQMLGVPIHYNMIVDFQAFSQAVNTVGGVTVNVPTQLYDPTMAWENNWNPVLAKAGVNNFDGKHALIYVRSRETSSDFARGERQRQVMVALKDKTATLGTLSNPVKISQLLSAFGDNVQSDIGLGDAQRMASLIKSIPSSSIQSLALTGGTVNLVTTDNVGGQSVVRPKAGYFAYTDIQAYVRNMLKDSYIAKENANVTVLNGTVTPGLATAKANELKSYGYNVGTVANAANTDFATTQIIDLTHGKDKYTLHYLQNRFNVQSVTSVLPAGVTAGQANIIVILGQDASADIQN